MKEIRNTDRDKNTKLGESQTVRIINYRIIDLIKALTPTTLIISILGYVDYITGEISIDILYVICICVVTWYTGIFIGIFCVIEIVLVKVIADYFDQIKIGTHLYDWNILNYLFMYLIICILTGKLKKTLSK